MEATTQEITLEEISKRKEALLKEIRQQKELMKATAADLFAPVKPAGKADAIMHSINSGIAVFDGVMLGMKVIKRIRKPFQR